MERFQLVATKELDDLQALRDIQLKEIEKLGRFADKCAGPFKEVLATLSAEFGALEHQIA